MKGEKEQLEKKLDRLHNVHTAMISELNNQIQKKEVTIKALKQKLSITFVDSVLFDSGKISITPEGRKILKKVGRILKETTGKMIRVVGHTDNIRIRPGYRTLIPSNWELSAFRAASVVRFFQNDVGINPENLEAAGRSFYAPVEMNSQKLGRAKNRRVDIIIAPKLD